jgi:hypothetical protein
MRHEQQKTVNHPDSAPTQFTMLNTIRSRFRKWIITCRRRILKRDALMLADVLRRFLRVRDDAI